MRYWANQQLQMSENGFDIEHPAAVDNKGVRPQSRHIREGSSFSLA